MLLTILGSGTSTGVPLIGCACATCRSRNSKNNRLRTSAVFDVEGKRILIDTSTDLRQQALRAKLFHIDAVLFTHPHADHVNGIDELRSYNFLQKKEIPVYGNSWTCKELFEKFGYIFQPQPKEGGGIPRIKMHEINPEVEYFKAAGVKIMPLAAMHGSKPCLGYRIGRIAYLTDCSYIPPSTLDRLQGLSVLVLNCLRERPHSTHFNLEQALEVIALLKPGKAYLTHLGHDLEYVKTSRRLPKGVYLSYDGLKIRGSTS